MRQTRTAFVGRIYLIQVAYITCTLFVLLWRWQCCLYIIYVACCVQSIPKVPEMMLSLNICRVDENIMLLRLIVHSLGGLGNFIDLWFNLLLSY